MAGARRRSRPRSGCRPCCPRRPAWSPRPRSSSSRRPDGGCWPGSAGSRAATAVQAAAQVLVVLVVVLVVRWPFGTWAEVVRRARGAVGAGLGRVRPRPARRRRPRRRGARGGGRGRGPARAPAARGGGPRWWPASGRCSSWSCRCSTRWSSSRCSPAPCPCPPGRCGPRSRRLAERAGRPGLRRARRRDVRAGDHAQRVRVRPGADPPGGAPGHAARGHDPAAGARRRRARDRPRRRGGRRRGARCSGRPGWRRSRSCSAWPLSVAARARAGGARRPERQPRRVGRGGGGRAARAAARPGRSPSRRSRWSAARSSGPRTPARWR